MAVVISDDYPIAGGPVLAEGLDDELVTIGDGALGGEGGEILEGKFLGSLAPSGFDIFDERSGLGTARAVQPFRSYLFDGANDFITQSNLTGGGSSLTLSAWIRTSASSGAIASEFLTTDSQRSWLFDVSGGKLRFLTSSNGSAGTQLSIVGNTNVNTGDWVHVAVTYDAGAVVMYVDGVDEGSLTGSAAASLFASSANLEIGSYQSGGTSNFNGSMSDVRIYSEPKSGAEITAIKAQEIDIADMVEWWKCDDTHDTIAYGCFAGNNGTKTNITPATFHAEGGTGWLPRSWQNDVGYSPRQLLGNGAGGIQGDFTTQTDATFYCEFTPGAVTSSGDVCYLLMSDYAASVGGQFGLVMQHFSAGRKIHYGNTSLRSSNDFNDGARNTAAIVRDDSEDEVTIRLNGTDTLTSSTAGVHGSTDVIAAGMKVSGGSPDFSTASAVISRCRVFDRALSASELDTLENGGEVSSGLLVSWDFDHSDTTINAADPGVSDGVQVGTRTDIFVSRDESDTANDVLGNPLDYVGPVPRNVVAINSNCVEFDGVDDYIPFPLLTSLASITVEIQFEYHAGEEQIFNISTSSSRYLSATINSTRSASEDFVVTSGNTGLSDETSRGKSGGFVSGNMYTLNVVLDANEDIVSATIDGIALGLSSSKSRIDNATVPQHRVGRRNAAAFLYSGKARGYKISGFGDWPLAEGEGVRHYDRLSGAYVEAMNTGGGYRTTAPNARPSNLLDGCSKVTYLDGTDDFVSADVGTFYEDNDTLEIEFELVKLDSGTSSIISIGEDNSNWIQVTGWSGGTQLRIMGEFSGSERAMNLTSPELGVYKVAVTKATETIIVTKPDGSTQEDDLTSLGVSGRADGSLYIGKRPILDDNFSDAIIRDVKLKDSSGTIVHHWRGYGHENWDDQVGSADGSVTGAVSMWIPAKSSSLDALGLTLTNPAGAWHNGAETQINFKPEPDAPWVRQIEDASGESIPDQYSHGDALPSFMSKVTDANGNESQFKILPVGA